MNSLKTVQVYQFIFYLTLQIEMIFYSDDLNLRYPLTGLTTELRKPSKHSHP